MIRLHYIFLEISILIFATVTANSKELPSVMDTKDQAQQLTDSKIILDSEANIELEILIVVCRFSIESKFNFLLGESF